MHDHRERGASTTFKSVHITNFYHKNSGGISTSYNNLLAAATRCRRHVRLVVPGETEDVETISEFAKIYYVPARHSPIIDRRYRVMMPWQYMLHGSTIRNILLAERPEVIEVTDKYTLSLIGPMIRTNNFRELGRPMLVHFSCERMDDSVRTFLRLGSVGKKICSNKKFVFLIFISQIPSTRRLSFWNRRMDTAASRANCRARFGRSLGRRRFL